MSEVELTDEDERSEVENNYTSLYVSTNILKVYEFS